MGAARRLGHAAGAFPRPRSGVPDPTPYMPKQRAGAEPAIAAPRNTCLATQLRLLRPLRLSCACSQHLIQVIFRSDTPAAPLKQGSPLQRQGHMMEVTFDLRFGL